MNNNCGLSDDENKYYNRLINMIFGSKLKRNEMFFTREEAEIIDNALDILGKREKEIIVRINRYEITTADMAREYHISKEEARYMLVKALRKLRHPSHAIEMSRILVSKVQDNCEG